MLAQVQSVTFIGMKVYKVDVQVHLSSVGLPCFNIVGLANKSIAESKERLRAAFSSIGLGIPIKRITVNLSPADLIKEGSHFDLSIAVGLLITMDLIPQKEVNDYLIMGEIALNGNITKVKGVLPSAIKASSLNCGIICPQSNGNEASWSNNQNILAPNNIISLIDHFRGRNIIETIKSNKVTQTDLSHSHDFQNVKGQKLAKRALEIAAAGGHNIIMCGPPSAGKSMLAQSFPSILPPLNFEEMIEISIIASLAGNFSDCLKEKRPFRDPHCSASMPAMVGGGRNGLPGEVTLAHLGVLFLDEIPEFSANVLESLRQPIESGSITIARVNVHINYPAKFQLIAAMNPCKCGYFDSNPCRKAPRCAEDYQNKISGPLLDRFDMQIDVPSIDPGKILQNDQILEESSQDILARVIKARDFQHSRYKNNEAVKLNCDLSGDLLYQMINKNEELKDIISKISAKYQISMRGFNRIIKMTRTIADLNQREEMIKSDLLEALSYRKISYGKY